MYRFYFVILELETDPALLDLAYSCRSITSGSFFNAAGLLTKTPFIISVSLASSFDACVDAAIELAPSS